MKFARYTFLIAGIYGFLVLVPMYFLEQKTGVDYPPAITHAEYFYGFIGTAIAFQVVFLVLSTNPVRYRAMIIPSIIEKFSFAVALAVLFLQNRAPLPILAGGAIDLVLGVLFVIAYFRTSGLETNG